MTKKAQKTAEEMTQEIAELDQEISGLEADKLTEERAALVEPLEVVQDKAAATYAPFAEAVGKLHAIWAEIEQIVIQSEQLRDSVRAARDKGRRFPQEAPAQLRSIVVPEPALPLFPVEERRMRALHILKERGDQTKICGRRFLVSRLRQGDINGMPMTRRQQKNLV